MVDQLKLITERVINRSRASRASYLELMERNSESFPPRKGLSCGNLAHGFAALEPANKFRLRQGQSANIGIVSSYNEMLSAHQPLGAYPEIIQQAAAEIGCTAQFAGGVPAMCDGVTQGQPGMELSLFSRDQIALSTVIALSHNLFDAALMLGVCDKIVPGLLIGALRFGHLPVAFVPAGPMPSGLSNSEKVRIRQEYAADKLDREALLEAEARSYHSPGTCTFYGTANSNQMLMEFMGLHLPGSSFINPRDPLRDALTRATTRQVAANSRLGESYRPLASIISEKAIINGIVGLLATGGSTNLCIHLVAIAAAAGIKINWQDFADLSEIVPTLARVYPNGNADVNHFHAAGGLPFLISQLLQGELLHADVETLVGKGLDAYTRQPVLREEELSWEECNSQPGDRDIVRSIAEPFSADGGLRILTGNLGTSVIKISALPAGRYRIEAPARVFHDQQGVMDAFKRDELERDCIVVVRFQGPKANGMPELHQLMPPLGVLQDKGFRVALITDGRMSGASGKVPAAIHLSPEAAQGGAIGKLRDGDMLRLDARTGKLEALIDDSVWQKRIPVTYDPEINRFNNRGLGRELFQFMRDGANGAEQGATLFNFD